MGPGPVRDLALLPPADAEGAQSIVLRCLAWGRVEGLVRVSGLGLRVEGRVLGFGFWVLGFGFWVLGFGFWVLGFRFRAWRQWHRS